MNQTKVTFSIMKPVARVLEKAIAKNFLKRDPFLNHLISVELPHIAEALKGRKNSTTARAFIDKSLDKKRATVALTVVLDKSVAERLSSITKKHVVSRDALINRILLFMLFGHSQLLKLEIQPLARDVESFTSYTEGVPTSPMSALAYIMDDPLFLIREDLRAIRKNMYLINLDSVTDGLNEKTACFLEDKDLPSSNPEVDELFADPSIFDLPERIPNE